MANVGGVTPPAELATSDAWGAELLVAARLMLRRHHGAAGDDLAQDALVVTLEAVRSGRLTTLDEARAFMHGTCKNLARAETRKSSRRRALLDENASMFESQARPLPVLDRGRLHACLNQLTARSRDVVLRSFVADEDALDIADAIGVTPENVRVIRCRALGALKQCMTGETG